MKTKIAYYVGTGLLTAMILMSAGMYLFNTAEISKAFTALGYPTYLIYPLAVAKLAGVAAIWSGFSPRLRFMAYAGFFFNFVLAATAHLAVGDGEAIGAFVALTLLAVSYFARIRLDVAPANDASTHASADASPSAA